MKLTIGEKITLLRKEKNITQTELAEYLYLTPQTVSRWEVGNGAPEITLLPRFECTHSATPSVITKSDASNNRCCHTSDAIFSFDEMFSLIPAKDILLIN